MNNVVVHLYWNRQSLAHHVQKQQVEYSSQLAKRGRDEFDADETQQRDDHSEIKNLLLSLTTKIDTMNNSIAENDDRLNVKIHKLNTSLNAKIVEIKNEMEMRIEAVAKDFDRRLGSFEMTTRQMCVNDVTEIVNAVNVRLVELESKHESKFDRFERQSLEKYLVISGVPLENNDNPIATIGDICGALNCNLRQDDFVTAFRLTSKNPIAKAKRTLPIIVKVQDDWVKQELLNAYFKKKNLNLTDIGWHWLEFTLMNDLRPWTATYLHEQLKQRSLKRYIATLPGGVSCLYNATKTVAPWP